AAEPHRGAVVAVLVVAVDLDRLPLEVRERPGAHAAEVEPPAAGEARAQVRAVGLAGLAARGGADRDAAVDVAEVGLAEVRVAAHVAATLVPGDIAQAADVLQLVAATAGEVGGVLTHAQREAGREVVADAHVHAQGEVDVVAGGLRRVGLAVEALVRVIHVDEGTGIAAVAVGQHLVADRAGLRGAGGQRRLAQQRDLAG